jgi:hypothetical protein
MDGLLSFLTPEQQTMARQQAQTQGLIGLGSSLLQASQGQPGQRKPSLGMAFAQAAPVGLQAYQGGMDQTLRDIVLGQQMQDAQRKRQQETDQQKAIQSYIAGLPRFQAFPTQAAEAMFRERKASPGVVGEYQAALADGLIGPEVTLPQFVAMKRPPGTTVNVGEKASPFEKKAQESQAEAFSEIQKSGTTAARSARDITRLGNILDKVGTGGTAAFKQSCWKLWY